MKKKILSFVFTIVILSMLLCGCVYDNTSVNIYPDGSGRVKAEMGLSKEILDKLGKTTKDFTSKYNEYHLLKVDGKEYLAETYEEAYGNPEEINGTSGISVISQELGLIDLIPVHNGLHLTINLNDDIGPDMKAEHILPDVKKITEESLYGMTLPDLIAQNVDGLNLKATFNMPYNVKQVSGGKTGVTVNGKKITLDYIKMIKSGDRKWEFEMIKKVKQDIFTDVPSSKSYANAVNAVADGGLLAGLSGYGAGDGKFHPTKDITLAELCKIIVNGLGETDLKNDSKYWAKNYINYAKSYGIVLSNASVIKKNWDKPATKEQVVYAIAIAANKQYSSSNISIDTIKDWTKINSKMRGYILWAYDLGIVNNKSDGTFGPKDTVTRAELCQMFYNAYWTVPKSEIVKEDREMWGLGQY